MNTLVSEKKNRTPKIPELIFFLDVGDRQSDS